MFSKSRLVCLFAVPFALLACGVPLEGEATQTPAEAAADTEALPSGLEPDQKVDYATSDWEGVVDGVAPESPSSEEAMAAQGSESAGDLGTDQQALTSPTTGWVSMPSGTRRISCPKGRVGPSSSAAAFITRIQSAKKYRIKYEVMPEGNFDFRAGGKLPGLGGGTAPTGGSSSTSGWSGRLMWNTGGRLSFYFYRVTGGSGGRDTGGYGTHWMWASDAKLKPGMWNKIEISVDMTTGETIGYLNGVQKARQMLSYQWSTTDKMVFSAFFGGQGAAYTPQKNEYLSFRNMQIHPG